jgi:hypothetical protein
MLSRAENVSIGFAPHLFSKQGHIVLVIGKKRADFRQLKMTRPEYGKFLSDKYDKPYRFTVSGKIYWYYEFKFYKDSDNLTANEVKALLITRKKLFRQRINRAITIAAVDNSPPVSRQAIPDDVKLLVWQRDEGKCAKCGSQTELQYDHIIPLSVGGASTETNLQILCGTCNRAKSASVV